MILVTGGTGLVGSHLLYELTSSGFNVKALKRSSSCLDNIKNTFKIYTSEYHQLFKNIEWIDGDMSDSASINNACEGIDTIYHCAAMVSFNPEDKDLMHKINIQGTSNIVDLCIKKDIRLCYVSSVASLGNYVNKPIDESSRFNPDTPHSQYSYSKFNSEEIVWKGVDKGLNVVIVNPSIILGFGHWHAGSSKLISTVAKGLSFYTNGKTGYVDVRDLCRAMHLLTETNIKSEKFILNGGNFTYRELFTFIAKALDLEPPKYYASPLLTGLGWRFAKLKSILTGKKASLTKETARSSHNISGFNGDKIQNFLPDFSYTPFYETITDICEAYKLQQFND